MRAPARPRAHARAHTSPTNIPHRLLDRLIRGRAWIGIIAFALIGIVAMQLWIVKLGYGIGRAVEHEGLLRRENSALSIANDQLSSGERVERLAAAKGMVEAAPGALHFDAVRPGLDARLAAAALARDAQAGSSGGSTASSSQAPASSSEAGSSSTESATTSSEAPAASGESAASSGESAAPSGESAASSGESAASSTEVAASSAESATSSGEASAPSGDSTAGEGTAPSTEATASAGAAAPSTAAPPVGSSEASPGG
ncbi:MAG TPA: hypothetical protein VMU32_12360 [Solirubrobacteraceae bacterium]|nr:hypothetical protein [Solirubrobacteraceae bacterium]